LLLRRENSPQVTVRSPAMMAGASLGTAASQPSKRSPKFHCMGLVISLPGLERQGEHTGILEIEEIGLVADRQSGVSHH
jgi:hypothetical protein